MKRKIFIGIIVTGSFLTIFAGVYVVKNLFEKSAQQNENSNQIIKIISVETVIKNPDSYLGFQEVEGTVMEIDKLKNIFLLGCEDACVFMPVEFRGEMPGPNSEIIVHGQLMKQIDGKYILRGEKIKVKKK